MTKNEKLKSEKSLATARELRFFNNYEALKLRAEIMQGLDKVESPDDWIKVIWYSEAVGGKVVRFKAGNPYAPKMGVRDDERSEEQKNEIRLKESLSRTKRRIFEISACNPWTWFFTGTLDGEKCDREDLNNTFKRLSQFLRDYRKKQDGERVVYLIIPEQHKDGAWHFHGLIHGLCTDELYKFTTKDKIPAKLKKQIKEGSDIYTWREYEKRFGWATFTAVRDYNAITRYITKYITKDLQKANLGSNRHLYYASKGLAKPEVLAEGHSKYGFFPISDFENDWVHITEIYEREEAEAIIKLCINGDLENFDNDIIEYVQ